MFFVRTVVYVDNIHVSQQGQQIITLKNVGHLWYLFTLECGPVLYTSTIRANKTALLNSPGHPCSLIALQYGSALNISCRGSLTNTNHITILVINYLSLPVLALFETPKAQAQLALLCNNNKMSLDGFFLDETLSKWRKVANFTNYEDLIRSGTLFLY